MCQGLTGAIINIILDPLMIFGIGPFPEMGIRGAALATVIGQIFGMALGLWGVFRQQKVLNVNMREFKWRGQTIKDIYRVGLPGIVMQSVVSVMTAGMNGILIAFSQTAVNVLGVYFKLQTFVFMPVFGLNQGALPVMGYNYGARNRKRLMGAYKITLTAAVVIMALGLVLFQLLPEQMLMLFVDKSDAAAAQKMIEVGVPALKTISCRSSRGVRHHQLHAVSGHRTRHEQPDRVCLPSAGRYPSGGVDSGSAVRLECGMVCIPDRRDRSILYLVYSALARIPHGASIPWY